MEYIFGIIGLVLGALIVILFERFKKEVIINQKTNDGIFQHSFSLVNGIIDGKELIKKDGIIVRERSWSKGLLSGESLKYRNDGKIIEQQSFDNGDLVEMTIYIYDENGNKMKEIILNDNFNGVEKLYYQTGELNKEKSIKNCLADGKSTTYYKNGSIYIIDEYKNGSLYKSSIVYDENGNVVK